MGDTSFPLGIDIGGSGIKGAPVDLRDGSLVRERHRIDTPPSSTPANVAAVVRSLADHFDADADRAPVGVTVPAVVTHGITQTAANIDDAWIGTDAVALLSDTLGRPVSVVNDADAVGIAELHYGAARGVKGVVIVTTLGTGIGSALLMDGQLVPNTEFGHLELDGAKAEAHAAASAREREDLSWKVWAKRLQRYYSHLEGLFWPDLIVVGGGVSRRAEKFLPLLELRTPIVAAELQNNGGIVGAAWLASNQPSNNRHG